MFVVDLTERELYEIQTKLSATLITNSPQEAASENLLISAISEKIDQLRDQDFKQQGLSCQYKLSYDKEKEKPKKSNRKKKPIKPIKFLKKPAGSVRFRFYKQKTKKTKPNRNRQKTKKKLSQTEKTEPNRKKPSQTRKKTEPKPRKPSQNRKNRAKPV